jgi:cobalamin-dependent methionine synthase I
VFAVGSLIRKAHRMIEEEAARANWRVGAELAPGQLAGWEIAEQKLLCGLVDTEAIGVTVTGAGMLVPQKSASMMVGIGPGYTSAEVRTPCEFCDLGDTCRWRH